MRPEIIHIRGFTLIELVLCLAIMAVFSAIAAPRYTNSIANYHVKVAANRIAADIEWARTLARSQSSSQSIVFDSNDSSYSLTGVSDPDNANQTYSVNLAARPYDSTLGNVSFNGSATLTFDGFGSPAKPGSVTITCGSATKTVTVSADSGNVSVQ